MKYGNLVADRKVNKDGSEYDVFRHEGPPLVKISRDFFLHSIDYYDLQHPRFGPERYQLLEEGYLQLVYVRKKYLLWPIIYSLYHVGLLFIDIKVRLIMTAWVWGLGKRTDGVVPSWRDIYFVNAVARIFGKDIRR